MAAVLMATMSGLPLQSYAASEQRCTALGANCVCSEPMNTATLVAQLDGGGQGNYYNPADSTTKQCSYEIANFPLWSGSQDLFASNDATATSRLPAGHSVTRFVSRTAGQDGGVWLSANETLVGLPSSGTGSFIQRMNIRFYIWHTTDYAFHNDPQQCHSKFLQPDNHFENAQGNIAMYEFTGSAWGPPSAFPRDCCFGAPGSEIVFTSSMWKGRWWRFELATSKRDGPGLRMILYAKDVTQGVSQINGGVEFVAADTFGTTGGPEPWTTSFNTVITHTPPIKPTTVNLFRGIQTAGGCPGTKGVSHYMVAGWDTDAGQRIGAASEVEGGADPVSPAAPFLRQP